MKLPIAYATLACVLGLQLATHAAADELFSLVVNPFTGSASLRNDGPAAVALDGYLLRASSPLFAPGGWNSLEDQSVTGWAETFPAANRMGETNLFGSLAIAPGQSVAVGSPYAPFVPSTIGELAPRFNFTYSIANGGTFTGDVEFSADNTVALVVDPSTGQSKLVNQSPFAVQIDSYVVTSSNSAIDTAGWTTLADSLGAAGGWQAATGATNRIAEGNLFGSQLLAANGGMLSIGAPIDPTILSDELDLRLRVSVAGVGTIPGVILFESAPTGLAGDYNDDRRVDAADYTTWRDGLGERFVAGDFTVWQANFGAQAPVGLQTAAAVPEPTGVVVLLGVLGAITTVRFAIGREDVSHGG